MHSEELVIEIGAQKLILGKGELDTHEQRQNSGEQEKDERRNDVAPRNVLVVRRLDPADQAGPSLPGDIERAMEQGIVLFRNLDFLDGERFHFKLSR